MTDELASGLAGWPRGMFVGHIQSSQKSERFQRAKMPIFRYVFRTPLSEPDRRNLDACGSVMQWESILQRAQHCHVKKRPR